MNTFVSMVIAIVGTFTGAAVADMTRAEFRARLDRVPYGLIRLAGRRLPQDVREDLVEEWTAELRDILHGTETLPITRLLSGIRYALGLAWAAPSIAKELTGVSPSSLSRAAWAYVAAIVVLAGGILLVGPYRGLDWQGTCVLAVAALACDELHARSKRRSISPSCAVAIAATLLLGPIGGALVGAISSLLVLGRGLGPVKRAFNGAQFTLSACIAAWVYSRFSATTGHIRPSDLLNMRAGSPLAPFSGSLVAYSFANLTFVGIIVWLTGRLEQKPLKLWMRDLVKMEMAYLATGSLALLIVVAWVAINPFAAVLVLLPLLGAQWIPRFRATSG